MAPQVPPNINQSAQHRAPRMTERLGNL